MERRTARGGRQGHHRGRSPPHAPSLGVSIAAQNGSWAWACTGLTLLDASSLAAQALLSDAPVVLASKVRKLGPGQAVVVGLSQAVDRVFAPVGTGRPAPPTVGVVHAALVLGEARGRAGSLGGGRGDVGGVLVGRDVLLEALRVGKGMVRGMVEEGGGGMEGFSRRREGRGERRGPPSDQDSSSQCEIN